MKRYRYKGQTKNILQWSKDPRCAVTAATLQYRVNAGWPFALALGGQNKDFWEKIEHKKRNYQRRESRREAREKRHAQKKKMSRK